MIHLNNIAIVKSQALISTAAYLRLFPLPLFLRVAEIIDNLTSNNLFASDITDLIKLIDVMNVNPEVSTEVKLENVSLRVYFKMKLHDFKKIEKNCGRDTILLGI